MEYTIVTADNFVDLEKHVSDYISKGWTPQGGVAVTFTLSAMMYSPKEYYQAMVRTK